METVGKNGSLVTDYAYEQNTYSDSRFLNDYLEKQPVYDEDATLVADGAYSGESNVRAAAEHQIKLVTTNFSGRRPDDIYADFKFSEDGRYLLECAGGYRPYKCSYDSSNERSAAYFSSKDCKECAYKARECKSS